MDHKRKQTLFSHFSHQTIQQIHANQLTHASKFGRRKL